MQASTSRRIGDLKVFETKDASAWEKVYYETMEKKYGKNTRHFNRQVTALNWSGSGKPPIFIIPRIRAGPSYKSVTMKVDARTLSSDEVAYCPISKGFPMQDVSSFTLGPIAGEGLCLVNAAFSKCICISHIEGGGQVDLTRKNFWKRARHPDRDILLVDDTSIKVDGKVYNTNEWLQKNEQLWRPSWEQWRKCVALCSRGSFHWADDSPLVSYFSPKLNERLGRYLSFVEWKKECYIRPSYELLETTPVMPFLRQTWQSHPLGLVHPMGLKGEAEVPITPEFIRSLYDSPTEMCCQPYVVVGKLLDVPVN